MKACITKLRSQKGASLILAAVYFLICAFVGGTVLAAATSGSAHLKDRKADEQTFLIQRSAARVIEQELTVEDGYLQAEIIKYVTDEGAYDYKTNNISSLTGLQALVAQAAAARYAEALDGVFDEYTAAGDLTLTMGENGAENPDVVNVHYEVDENYDLTVTLSQNGDSRLYVFMKASVTEKTRDDVTTTTITWNEPIIRKGGGAA